MLRCARGITSLSIGVILVDQILHDRPALEDTLLTIEDSGDSAVRINFEKPALQEN